jgi:signal transduction histidine kinase
MPTPRNPRSHARTPRLGAAVATEIAALAAVIAAAALWDLRAGLAALASATATAGIAAGRGRATVVAETETPPSVAPAAGAETGSPAFVSIARRIQATVNQQLHDLREMQDRHGGDPAVFGDLLHLDHGVSLIGRLADSLAVLGGARTSRQWARPVDVLGVARGAMSRIVEYRRVDVEVPADRAVAAAAVEPVVHALAEFLDNATRYSSPDSRVRVAAVRTADGGLVLLVDDAGVGLSAQTADHIRRVLSGAPGEAGPVDPAGPTRLGLAVVGRLARANGFRATVSTRDDGGTRAEIRLPAELITEPDEGRPPAEQPPRPARRTGPSSSAAPQREPEAVGPGGLPQRRRATAVPPNADLFRAAPAAGSAGSPAGPTAGSDTAAQTGPGQWIGAFIAGKDDPRS